MFIHYPKLSINCNMNDSNRIALLRTKSREGELNKKSRGISQTETWSTTVIKIQGGGGGICDRYIRQWSTTGWIRNEEKSGICEI